MADRADFLAYDRLSWAETGRLPAEERSPRWLLVLVAIGLIMFGLFATVSRRFASQPSRMAWPMSPGNCRAIAKKPVSASR
jgi:hypothetical protein